LRRGVKGMRLGIAERVMIEGYHPDELTGV
jgi:hypothetical protein